jgi:hypothetical protein
VVVRGGEAVVTAPELALTCVPGTVRNGCGVPPRDPTAKAFMSIEYTPEQSFGGGLPPEFSGIERRIGVLMQRRPPEKGTAA